MKTIYDLIKIPAIHDDNIGIVIPARALSFNENGKSESFPLDAFELLHSMLLEFLEDEYKKSPNYPVWKIDDGYIYSCEPYHINLSANSIFIQVSEDYREFVANIFKR